MKSLLVSILRRRASALSKALAPHIPPRSSVLDVGCGTGHLVAELSRRGCRVIGADVSRLDVVRVPQFLYDGERLPLADGSIETVVLSSVLAYPPSATDLLEECLRVSSHRVIVIQSLYRTPWGRLRLTLRELLWTRAGLLLSTLAGLVRSDRHVLRARRFFTAESLERDIVAAQGVVERRESVAVLWPIRQQLIIVRKSADAGIYPHAKPRQNDLGYHPSP